MRKVLQLCWLLLLTAAASAQERTVSGKVTDSRTAEALAGVTVTEKNTNNFTATNADGAYSIAVKGKNAVLVFTYIGLATTELDVNGNELNLAMKAENKALQEVFVVAYGNQTKRNSTSAVSVVTSDQIKRQQVTTVTQALQGTAPGVMVVNTSGQPGENPQIRIRGIASVNASAEPLIVVDGIPFNGNLNMISPNDIDNFSVLKDATATALYGSRAANGVILINTKGGRKNQKAKVTLNANFGWASRALPEYSFVTQQQLMELNWEGLRNNNVDAGVADPEAVASEDLIENHLRYNPYVVAQPVGTDGKLKPGLTPAWNTDWTKELTRSSALRRDYNVGVAGGSNNSSYYLGLGYLGQEGYVITSQYKRASVRFNFNTDVNRWLTLGVRSQYVYSDQNFPEQSTSSFDNVIQYIRSMSSIYPVYQRGDDGNLILDSEGKPVYDFGNPKPGQTYNQNRQTLQPSNLLATTVLNTERRQRHMTTVNGFAEIKLLNSLRWRTNFGLDRYTLGSLSYENPDFGNGTSVGGRLGRSASGTTSWTLNNMLTYKEKFGDHSVEWMASSEFYRYQFEDITGQKTRFPFSGLYEFNTAANTESLSGYSDNLAIMSAFSRLKYDYKGKYFIEGTVRWDGSSRFDKDYRWGFFPAVGASWLLSEEGFMQPLASKVNLLKLRASYGRVGNEALNSYFPYISTFGPGITLPFEITYSNLDQPGFYLGQLGNQSIKWETQGNFNIGLDFALFNNRLSGSVDYFKKSAIDLLFRRPLVLSGGVPFIDFNIGDLFNRGVEINLNGSVIKNKNFNWEVGANATFVRNKLTKLPQDKITSGAYQQEVGKSIYEFFMAEWAGVDPTDGHGMWYADETDGSGNPTGKKVTTKEYADATRYYQGSAIPKVTGGFTTKLEYKGFDLSALVNFALGGKYYDDSYAGLVGGISSSPGDQLHTDLLNRWQKAGDITAIPRLDINNTDYVQTSTRFLFKGDYARLRNVTLGYNWKPRKANFMEAVRLYLQADNMLTFSGLKKGADPEANVDGLTRQTSSAFKIFSVGVEVGF